MVGGVSTLLVAASCMSGAIAGIVRGVGRSMFSVLAPAGGAVVLLLVTGNWFSVAVPIPVPVEAGMAESP